MTPQEHSLLDICNPIIDEAGYELVRLRLTGAKSKTLQIMAERPDGTMSAQDCARLSRALSPALEELDPIKEQYTLEVSSAGIDRPLTRLKDFERWDGFVAKIELTQKVEEQRRFRGTLAGIEGDDICIDLDGEDDTAIIPFSLIHQAKLVLTDELIKESLRQAKKAGTAPSDAEAYENQLETDHDTIDAFDNKPDTQ